MEHFTRQEKILTLIGILLALFLGALDQTIVATALPQIVKDLKGMERFSWVATAYLVASTSLVPIYGKLADTYNRKTIELVAVSLFLLGSFLCGLAGEFGSLPLIGDGMNQLILFRAIQGLGGAGLFAMAFIVIADLFPPAERGKYQGIVGSVFGLSSVLGPWLGGLLTDHFTDLIPGVAGWRWVFYVNLPTGIVALWFLVTKMPSLRPHGTDRLDYPSAFLLLFGLAPLVTALQLDKTEYPWGGTTTLLLFAIAFVCLLLFVLRSLRVPTPVLDLALFKNTVFRASNIALFFYGAAFFSTVIFLPLFMVTVLGVSATKAGVSLIPLSLGLVAGSALSGQLVSRFGHYKRWMLAGGLLMAVGIFLLSQMQSDVSYGRVVLYMLVCGLGIGPTMPLFPLAIQNAVDRSHIGQATSASQFFRQIGGAIGAALMGTILTTGLTTYLNDHLKNMPAGPDMESRRSEMTSGNADISKTIIQGAETLYLQIEKVVNNKDTAALNSILKNPYLPKEMKMGLAAGRVNKHMLPGIHRTIVEKARETGAMIQTTMKEAFTVSITRIFFISIFIVLMGWIATWFVPEYPLKKTHGEVPIVMD
jgi:EmrB/QacA subfamily drug resistance transporter